MSELIWLYKTDSTNRYLKERRTLPHGTACATDRQTAGRGRLGRTWDAPAGKTLALSVLLHIGVQPTLPLVCALVVADVLRERTGADFRWKWPNDIVCGGRKVCGILCESVTEGDRLTMIAGIGVNLTQTEEELTAAGLPHAASVALLCGVELAPQELAQAIVSRLLPTVQTLCGEGFVPFAARYAAGCVTLGKEVCVHDTNGDVRLRGTAEAIDPDGSLLLRTADGALVRCAEGEVSVRGLYGYL